MKITVKKGNKPAPPHRGRRRKYPLDRMEIGEYFDVAASYQAVWSSIRHFRKKCVKKAGCPKFQIDTLDSGEVRVTRVS